MTAVSQTIVVRHRQDIPATVRRAVAILTGREASASDARDAMLTRVGLRFQAKNREAFIVKSHGGTDETGLRWPPLSPATIAYRRRHAGLPPASQRTELRPSASLTVRQRLRWKSLYARLLRKYRGDKGHAAAVAWLILKSEGATTLLKQYGGTPVDILRDTGELLTSLSPGSAPDARHATPVQSQVFRVGINSVVVGTTRKGASGHHHGIPGKLPQRRLWPKPSTWPQDWWDSIAEPVQEAVIEVIQQLLRDAA